MNKVSFAILGLAIGCFINSNSFAQTPQEIVAECTTKGTDLNGSRNNCDSDVIRITAPPGYVFAQASLQGGETTGNGSEHECHIGWEDLVEIIPKSQITQPRTLTLQAHARSPKHHPGARGWVKCKYTALISKYQN